MNMFKKNGGFTLVELIVVIAILAILAAVAVPAYNGYIAKANDSAVLTELTALHTAAQAACSMNGDALEYITVDANGEITVSPLANYGEFYDSTAQLKTLIAKHSVYGEVGCSWLATDPEGDTWSAGWNAGVYTVPAAPAPEG